MRNDMQQRSPDRLKPWTLQLMNPQATKQANPSKISFQVRPSFTCSSRSIPCLQMLHISRSTSAGLNRCHCCCYFVDCRWHSLDWNLAGLALRLLCFCIWTILSGPSFGRSASITLFVLAAEPSKVRALNEQHCVNAVQVVFFKKKTIV